MTGSLIDESEHWAADAIADHVRQEALRVGFWNEGLMDTREVNPTDDCD